MRQLIELQLRPTSIKDITNGYPLILKDAIETSEVTIEHGSLLHLVDKNGGYIATGYYGVQNKGIGWVLSRKEKEKVDKKFFVKKIRLAADKRANLYASKDTTAFRVFKRCAENYE